MIIHIPPKNTKRWTGIYQGDYYGTLYKTFNTDLDRKEGKVALSTRMSLIGDTTDTNTDTLGVVDAFAMTDADCTMRWWALSAGGRMYRTTQATPDTTWALDTLASSPDCGVKDMTVFETDSRGDSAGRAQLFVTKDTGSLGDSGNGDISVLNDTGNSAWTASWWISTKSQPALKSGVPIPIQYFPFRRLVLIGNGNKIHTVSRTSITASETVTNARLTLPQELQVEYIFYTSTRAWILCSHTGGGSGKIIEWDGFSETYNQVHDAYGKPLAGVNYREVPIILNDQGVILEYSGSGFTPMIRNGQAVKLFTSDNYVPNMSARGMAVSENLIYINVSVGGEPSERYRGGIWCLSPITGRFYNKYALGQWDNDFGQQRPADVGALYGIQQYSLGVSGGSGNNLLAGGAIFGDINNTKYGIWTLSSLVGTTTATRGHFVTQFLPASEVRDLWDSLWIRFKRFINSNNRIVVKARGTRSLVDQNYRVLEAQATWVNATSFTVTLNSSADSLAVGDEVEVMSGDNAGSTAHISTISGNHGAAQTITIDETLNASTNVSIVAFQRWKKLGVISSTTAYEEPLNIGIDSSFIQLKVEMRGPAAEMEVDSLIVNTNPNLHLKK